MAGLIHLELLTDFFNKIGQKRQIDDIRAMSACPPIVLQKSPTAADRPIMGKI